MKIKKITEKTYWRLEAPDGEVVFRPPHKSDVPFKSVVTFDDNGNPFVEHHYMSDGKHFAKNYITDNFLRVNYTVETESNSQGLVTYKRLELSDTDAIDCECWIPRQERYYFYDSDNRLSRKEVINTLNHHVVDQYGSQIVAEGQTVSLKYELHYNASGHITLRRKYKLDSPEIEHEIRYRYAYDHFGNIVYREHYADGVLELKEYFKITYR